MRRLPLLVLLALAALEPATAGAHPASPFPKTIALPVGFQPEGIAIAHKTFYVGSIPTGAIYRGDLRTGTGAVLVASQPGRAAIGMKVTHDGRLFVAGGPTGHGFVYDARSGAPLGDHVLAGGTPFINDVALGHDEAYFTNSRAAEVLAVGLRGGPVRRIALGGDYQQVGDATTTNLNGIVVAGRHTLIVVQSNTGRLFAVDARTGVARAIDLGGADILNGDGLLLQGRTLFVVQNRLNRIAVVALSRHLARGQVVATITDPAFDIPTTIAAQGRSLWAVNARFGTPSPQTAEYNIVRVP